MSWRDDKGVDWEYYEEYEGDANDGMVMICVKASE